VLKSAGENWAIPGTFHFLLHKYIIDIRTYIMRVYSSPSYYIHYIYSETFSECTAYMSIVYHTALVYQTRLVYETLLIYQTP